MIDVIILKILLNWNVFFVAGRVWVLNDLNDQTKTSEEKENHSDFYRM